MRMYPLAIAAAATIGATTMAFAADATGVVKSIDTKTDQVTLSDGATYTAPKTIDLSKFKVGEKVTISYTGTGKMMEATSISPAG